MILFDILYNITIYPIEFIIEIVFYLFNNVFKSGYATSLFFLSLVINFISLPLYNIAESWQAKERAIQEKMKPMIDNIKAVYKGDQRYLLIRTCQRINGYKTIYAFRGTLGLLIQIPFFLAAYNFIHNLSGLQLGGFLFIKDFSKPDGILNIGNISVNILPFIMTLFSLLAGLVYSKKLRFKESLPLYIVSLIFLVLLYNSPSGLVFYWTLNCLFSLIKNIFIEYKLYKVFVVNKNKILKCYNVFFVILTIIFILLLSLGNIEKKGYLSDFSFERFEEENISYHFKLFYYSKIFRHNDIYGVKVDKNKLNNDSIIDIKFEDNGSPYGNIVLNDYIENIGKIEVYYKLFIKKYIINILIILFILFILFNSYKYIFKIFSDGFLEKRNLLIISSCLVISVLSGLFISSSLIGNSPTEFKNPFDLIINDFSMSLGLFLFYPLFIYILFSEKIKNYLTLLLIFVASFVLINTFIMKGNYININADFVFDNTDLLKASLKEILLTIILTVVLISIIILIIKKKKLIFIINIYFIVILALIGVSIFDISKIIKEHNKLKNIQVDNKSSDIKIFNMSKTGKNVFVFVLDRAINSYWLDAFERFTNYKKDFDGFIFYPNTVSFSDFTATAASLYGGYDYLPYEISANGGYNLEEKHNQALLTISLALEKYNYKSTMLNIPYANFQLYNYLNIHTNIKAYDNNTIYEYSINKYLNIQTNDYANNNSFNKKIMRFSIFRMLPINLRYDFYRDKGWFLSSSSFPRINSSIRYYSMLLSTPFFVSIKQRGDYYNSLYNIITHEPDFFSSDFLPYSELKEVDNKDLIIYKDDNSVRHFYANVASINCITNFITYLKKNNIYDNTKIIIVSDHGRNVNTKAFDKNIEFANWYNALLMYKDFNSKGEIKIDTNFMTIADTPYLATKHIPNIKNPFNNKLITNDYKTNGAYIIMPNSLEPSQQFSNRYNFNVYYHVKDNIFDINNWKKFVVDWRTKESKEIKLK
ncbi:MAG: YidC/Oxa1 family membrane protein insertase [Brachyspira sp.]|nr:YidC/Oxa1 family membrane protein insertase [Brachyspira sp.]